MKTKDLQKFFRLFLTRFSRYNWFFAMLKISTEHGSGWSADGSCVSETVSNIESITQEVVLVMYHILS